VDWVLEEVQKIRYFPQRPMALVDLRVLDGELSIYFLDVARKRIFTIRFEHGVPSNKVPGGGKNWAEGVSWKYEE